MKKSPIILLLLFTLCAGASFVKTKGSSKTFYEPSKLTPGRFATVTKVAAASK